MADPNKCWEAMLSDFQQDQVFRLLTQGKAGDGRRPSRVGHIFAKQAA